MNRQTQLQRATASLWAVGVLAATGIGFAASANAAPISGANESTENSCTIISSLFGGFDCGYAASAPIFVAISFAGWSGPVYGAGYFAAGSIGDNISYPPVPGDGKISPTITGDLTVAGSGPGASISGTFVIGAAVRNISTGQASRAVQGWESITHTLAPTVVTSATPNGQGGFDYWIGNAPGQLCRTADPTDCFATEVGAGTTTGPAGYWNNGVKPTVGIARSTLRDNNPGATTSAVIAGDTCSSTSATDCTSSAILWGRGEDAGWDNLLLKVSTDAAGNVVSGLGYWTQEYSIAVGGPELQADSNSWQASAFTFAAASDLPACADFAVDVVENSNNNVIPALEQCSNFGGALAISIVDGPVNGTASVNGANEIIYTPNAGFTGVDTITFSGNDGTDSDNGLLTVTVTAAVDTDPDPFVFNDVIGQDPGSQVISNAITVAGINAATAITVSGGEYSINGGAFTDAAGTVVAGDSVRARVTTSATPSTETSVTVTIGGRADTFTATTGAVLEDTTPDPFTFNDLADVALGAVETSNTVTITGINAPASILVVTPTNGTGEYSIGCTGTFTSAQGTISNNETVCVRHTNSTSPSTAVNTTLTVGGLTADTFTTTTVATVADTNPDQFSFDDQEGVGRDTVIISDPVTITGINSPAAITVTGGDYSIGCTGTFTSDPGIINNGQTVCVRHTSASNSDSAVTTTLTVGTAPDSKSDAFTSLTRRSGGSSSMDALSLLGLIGLMALLRGDRRRSSDRPS